MLCEFSLSFTSLSEGSKNNVDDDGTTGEVRKVSDKFLFIIIMWNFGFPIFIDLRKWNKRQNSLDSTFFPFNEWKEGRNNFARTIENLMKLKKPINFDATVGEEKVFFFYLFEIKIIIINRILERPSKKPLFIEPLKSNYQSFDVWCFETVWL